MPTVLTLALGASTGCGSDEPAASPASPTSAATSATADATADSSADASAAASPTRRPNRTLSPLPPQPLHARPARTHLLDATRMPVLATDLAWTEVADGDGSRPVGACQKASLFDIGALRTTERRFATADGSTTATQVVGEFPDRKSAWRAAEVLLAWRADCADRLDHARTAVGEVRDVPVAAGFGSAYRASYGSRAPRSGRATGLGILRRGGWLSVVELATDEHRWPTGWDPARQAVRRIAKTFRG